MGRRSPTNWSVADGWTPPPRVAGAVPRWSVVEPLQARLRTLTDELARVLTTSVAAWDARLSDLGGDPSRHDWSSFRPLRLSREEDWSDWLAHLIEHDASGRFTARLFGASADEASVWKATRCEREYVVEDYRADLLIDRASSWVHLEVKVGDLSFAKTAATGEAARRRREGSDCSGDYVLLPAEHVALWHLEAEDSACSEVGVRTWTDVAQALRESLVELEQQTVPWRAWAWAFLGAVEQHLLEFPRLPRDAAPRLTGTATALECARFLGAMETT
jgi:hypothetical protein